MFVFQECVLTLHTAGVDMNTQDASGFTPIHWATSQSKHKVIALHI